MSGVRPAAAGIDVPHTTARDWVRRFRARARVLRSGFAALTIEFGGDVETRQRGDTVVVMRSAHRAAAGRHEVLTAGSWQVFGRFEAEAPNTRWITDVLVGPFVPYPQTAVSVRARLFLIVDDHSRLLVHGGFQPVENTREGQDVLRQAIVRCDLPEVLYADNGAPFQQPRLGPHLCHSRHPLGTLPGPGSVAKSQKRLKRHRRTRRTIRHTTQRRAPTSSQTTRRSRPHRLVRTRDDDTRPIRNSPSPEQPEAQGHRRQCAARWV